MWYSSCCKLNLLLSDLLLSIGIGGLEIPLVIVLIECLVLFVLVEFRVFLGHFLDEILVELGRRAVTLSFMSKRMGGAENAIVF